MENNKDIDWEIKRTIAEDFTYKVRGEIIETAIEIENTLDNIIVFLFMPFEYSRNEFLTLNNNGLALKTFLLRKIDFCDKISMLKDIISLQKPEVFNQHRPLILRIVKDMDESRCFRNLLAHCESNLSMEFLDDSVNNRKIDKFQINEYKKGRITPLTFSKDQYSTKLQTMSDVLFRLWQLFALLNDDLELASKLEILNQQHS